MKPAPPRPAKVTPADYQKVLAAARTFESGRFSFRELAKAAKLPDEPVSHAVNLLIGAHIITVDSLHNQSVLTDG